MEPDDPRQLPIPDWLGLCCPRCEYPLRGLPEHRCPECGLEFRIEDLITTVTPLQPPTITATTRPVPELGLDCRRCGASLTGAERNQCPRCGEQFDLEAQLPNRAWVRMGSGKSAFEINLMLLVLRNAGIPCVCFSETLRGIVGTAPLGGGTDLRVHRVYYFDALHVIATQPARTGEESAWECGQCGEEVPDNFDICWHCGAERAAEA